MSSQNLSKTASKKNRNQLKKHSKSGKHHPDTFRKQLTKRHIKSKHTKGIDYQIFLYREELRRANTDFSYLRLSRAKIMLTAKLIAKNIDKWDKMCSVEDLKVLSRAVQFKKRLCTQVERLEQFQQLGLTDVVLNGKRKVL